uniref:Uncharacterized protein n=1 Tax=Cacopsylla melanoneura TaxID=428564 RepID=A0A8D9F251_9HEMI
MGKTTSADRMRKMRAKLKEDSNSEKYKAFLDKDKTRQAKRRVEKKIELANDSKKLALKRLKDKERQRKSRQRRKGLGESSSAFTPYKCPQTLSKAVKKVTSNLPSTPRRKKAVIEKIVKDYCPQLSKRKLFNNDHTPSSKKSQEDQDVASLVLKFYERDDISRQAPGRKDVKSIRDKTGKKQYVPKRHMILTVLETYQLFKEEYPDVSIKKSKFYCLRPPNVLLSSEMPHNVCVCKYHANVIFLTQALHKLVYSFPPDHTTLICRLTCNVEDEKCMTGVCKECCDKSPDSFIEKSDDLKLNATWNQWKEIDGRQELVLTEGTVQEAVNDLKEQIAYFKVHSYVKRVQTLAFLEAKNNMKENELVIQIDYAENYASIYQDEIQSAHWNNKQISIFTCCAWVKDTTRSFALVSDNLNHDKYSVYTHIKKILDDLCVQFPSLETVKIFSDGCAAQFKNKYTLSVLCFLEEDFKLQNGQWLFFATSHGKGCVDGIGGLVKRLVWNEVKSRRSKIGSAEDFVECASKKTDKIKITLVSNLEIEKNKMKLDKRWADILPIKGLQSKHYFKSHSTDTIAAARTERSKIDYFKIVKCVCRVEELYSSSSSEEDNCLHTQESPSPSGISSVTRSAIKPGVFVLVNFQSEKNKTYTYVATCQTSIDDKNEVKIMCLNKVGNSNSLFKSNEKDVSFIELKQIIGILPCPTITLRGMFQFPQALKLVYERA